VCNDSRAAMAVGCAATCGICGKYNYLSNAYPRYCIKYEFETHRSNLLALTITDLKSDGCGGESHYDGKEDKNWFMYKYTK
jgi:hypothetical protein